MGDKVKVLRKENDDLKSQLNDPKKEFQFLKSKMAEQKDYHKAAATALLSTHDVQFLRDSYDALVKSESSFLKALDNFSCGWIYWQLLIIICNTFSLLVVSSNCCQF